MLNDLGRKGQKVVIVTKREGERRIDPVDATIIVHQTLTDRPGPMGVRIPKPRQPSSGRHHFMGAFDNGALFTVGDDDGQSDSQAQDD